MGSEIIVREVFRVICREMRSKIDSLSKTPDSSTNSSSEESSTKEVTPLKKKIRID